MKYRALWKDLCMELKTTWNRFLSILLIVALGVAFFAGIKASNPDMKLTADFYFDENNLMDIQILGSNGITQEEIDDIAKIAQVEKIESSRTTHVVSDIDGSNKVLELISTPKEINQITIHEGRMPQSIIEVVIDRSLAKSTGIRIGDSITVESGSEVNMGHILKENIVTIVGIGSTPYYLSFQRGQAKVGSGIVDGFLMVHEDIFLFDHYTTAYILVEGAKEKVAFTKEYEQYINTAKIGLERQLLDSTKQWFVLDRNSNEAYVEFKHNAERMGALGEIFPLIFYLVAALISLTTMTRMVEEQRTQIGILKALGYSKTAISAKYILYALMATLVGSILGAILGLKLLPSIIISAYKIMYSNLPRILTPFHWYFGGLATGFSIISVGTATFLACYKALKSKPSVLMRPIAPKVGKRVLLERIPFLWNQINFSWKATLRNLFRYKKRFSMTVIGIGGCMSLLLVGFGLKDSIEAVYNTQFTRIKKQDISIAVKPNPSSDDLRNFERVMREEEFIDDFMINRAMTGTVEKGSLKKNVNIVTFPEGVNIDSFIQLKERKNNRTIAMPIDGLIITEQLATSLQLKVGDAIRLSEGDSSADTTVRGITENYLDHFAYLSSDAYRLLFAKTPQYNQYYITINSGVNPSKIGDKLLLYSQATGVFYTSYYESLMENVMVSMNMAIWVIIVAAGALAYIVLYNLNNININERRRELATIKVLGFYNRELSSYIYRENIILMILGIIVGIFLGISLHDFVIKTVETDMLMFGRDIHWLSFVWSVMITVLFTVMVNVVTLFRLQRINMVESLKSVE